MYVHSGIHFYSHSEAFILPGETLRRACVNENKISVRMKGKAGEEVEIEERGCLKQAVSWEGWHFSAEMARDGSRHTEGSQKGQRQLGLAGFCHTSKKWWWLKEANGRRQNSWRRRGAGRAMTASMKISH